MVKLTFELSHSQILVYAHHSVYIPNLFQGSCDLRINPGFHLVLMCDMNLFAERLGDLCRTSAGTSGIIHPRRVHAAALMVNTV